MLSSMRAIGYVRVSTDKQADHGVSLEAQEAKIRAMATVQGAEIVELIVDGGESAKNLKRPGMERLLTLVDERKVDTVIIAKLDRLTRSVKDLAELLERFQRRGVSLVSVAESLDTGSAAGRLVINIMTAVSQWEREAIGERTRDAMWHKRSNGERVGNISYGYRLGTDGKQLEPDPGEQAVLTAIRDLRARRCTLRGIAAELNARGWHTRRASSWRLEHVARILRPPRKG
jgi:DNA invertase Pin-like site-specific DNA recombinase